MQPSDPAGAVFANINTTALFFGQMLETGAAVD
jgi:hypothetical protein